MLLPDIPVAAQRVPSSLHSSLRLFFVVVFCLFKAIRFSLFPLLSPGTRRDPAPGALPKRAAAPDRPPGPRLLAPGSWAAAQQRRLWDEGRGCGGGEGSATAAVPAARTPPPLVGPTLFRTVRCACSVGTWTLGLHPLTSCLLFGPLPGPSLPPLSCPSQQRCQPRGRMAEERNQS